MLGEQITVMILGGNQEINNALQSDLGILGFKPLLGRYPDVDADDITQNHPYVILLNLTAYDRDALSVSELLLTENILPTGIALIALISENTMERISIHKFDDIIKFPCHIAEFSFRLHRVIKLHHPEISEDTIRIGDVSLTPSRYEVKVKGQVVLFTYREYELLKHLVTHPNYVFTREALLTSVWDYDQIGDSRTVDVHIRRIREKIGDIDQTYIRTVRGVGYAFHFKG